MSEAVAEQVVDTVVDLPVEGRYMIALPELTEGVKDLEGVEIEEEKLLSLDANTAGVFQKLPTFIGERPLRRAHVASLMNAYLRGTFLKELVTIMTCTVGKREYRINGQHTAEMIRILAAKHNPNIKIRVRFIRWHARNMDDMRSLYVNIDRNAPRTTSNQINAILSGDADFVQMGQDTCRRLAEGMNVFAFETSHQRRGHDAQDRAALLSHEYRRTALQIGKILEGGTKENVRHLLRSAVVGAMFATFETARGPAEIFWKGVRDGQGLRGTNNPILRLRDWLKDTAVSNRGAGQFKKKTSIEQMYRKAVVAWNAYRRNEGLVMMNAPMNTKSRPVPR